MSYTPTNWQNGDTITAEKLNKLENGVASSGGGEESPVFILRFTLNQNTPPVGSYDSTTTVGELHDVLAAKKYVIALIDEGSDDENVSFTYPVIVAMGFYEENDKWNLWGTFKVNNKTLDLEANEDYADYPISVPIPLN